MECWNYIKYGNPKANVNEQFVLNMATDVSLH